MNEELNEILKFYEDEKLALEDIIKCYIDEFEYKAAYFHSKALKRVNQKIQLLKNLKNPNSDKLDELNRSKKLYDIVHPDLKDNKEYLTHLQNNKTQIDNQIEQIINQSNRDFLDGQEFDDVIFRLVENNIMHFRLQLNANLNLCLDFKKVEENLKISIENYKALKNNFIISKSTKRALKSIGLKRDKIEDNLSLIYPLKDFKNSIEIKIIVSRIIYDGIGYFNINNKSHIEILE